MESSPLTKAHDHAKAASVATQTSDTTVAINEHTLAAGEFSNAAGSTSSVEALRTLKLLEQHHRRLSELLKLPLDKAASQHSLIHEESEIEDNEKLAVINETGGDAKGPGKQSGKQARSDDVPAVAPTPMGSAKPVPTLSSQQRRYPGRDLSSSIASNLASARGIKSKYRVQPLTPSVSNEQAPGNLEVHPRREGSSRGSGRSDQGGKPSWVPPTPLKTDARGGDSPKPQEGSPNPNEEGFSKFYSAFGSIMNRLSAPLAFAGLPLASEEVSPEPAPTEPPSQQKRVRHKSSTTVSTEPDIGKLYSRATIRALTKDGRGPTDSFYVVPTTGHTASYANILTYDQKERRRLAASVHGGSDDASLLGDEADEDDFLDAREGPMSPALRLRAGKTLSERDMNNVIEELRTENGSLKGMLDKLSKRLHAFELNSQSSHLALAQSLRLQRPGSPMSSSGGGGTGSKTELPGSDEALRKRNRELEEQLAGAMKQMDALEREYSKVQSTVEKYRDRWEKLKAGAKARREAQETSENTDAAK